MALGDQAKAGGAPPYVPYKSWETFVGKMKSTALPSHIDNSIMNGLSGTVRSQLVIALRFLGMVTGDDNAVQAPFREIVAAYDTEEWTTVLARHILRAYQPIVDGLHITSATQAQVIDRFRKAGVEGDTAKKASRFYLAAMKAAGADLSPHLKLRERASGSGRARRAAKGERAKAAGNQTPVVPTTPATPPPPPDGTMVYSFNLPNKPTVTVTVPKDMTEREWALVDGYVRTFIDEPKK